MARSSTTFKKGHKLSKESLQKMILSKVGKPSKKRGIPLSEETKQKLSKALRGRPSKLKGKAHPNWKGGITPLRKKLYFSIEYKLWRKAIFERDNYTCIWCGQRGVTLNADHIKPWAFYPELRFAIDNGRTLCVDCHRKTDTWGVRVKERGTS